MEVLAKWGETWSLDLFEGLTASEDVVEDREDEEERRTLEGFLPEEAADFLSFSFFLFRSSTSFALPFFSLSFFSLPFFSFSFLSLLFLESDLDLEPAACLFPEVP